MSSETLHHQCFGEFIRKRRAARRLTQTELAARVGLSAARLSNYEAGRFYKLPPADVFLQLVEELGVREEALLDAAGVDIFRFTAMRIVHAFGSSLSPEDMVAIIFLTPEHVRHTAACIAARHPDRATGRRAVEIARASRLAGQPVAAAERRAAAASAEEVAA